MNRENESGKEIESSEEGPAVPYLPKGRRELLNHFMQRSDHAIICALFRKHHLTKVNIEND